MRHRASRGAGSHNEVNATRLGEAQAEQVRQNRLVAGRGATQKVLVGLLVAVAAIAISPDTARDCRVLSVALQSHLNKSGDYDRSAGMDEMKAAIIGAVVGAAAAFISGNCRTPNEEAAQGGRGYWPPLGAISITFAMDTLRGNWTGFRVEVEMPMVIHDSFPQFVDLFDSSTVLAVLDMRGSCRDLLVGLTLSRIRVSWTRRSGS